MASPIADGGGFQDAAEVIDFEGQRVRDTGVSLVVLVQFALVVVTNGFARVGEEDGVAIISSGLQTSDREVLLGDNVRMALFFVAVERVNFLSQHCALSER